MLCSPPALLRLGCVQPAQRQQLHEALVGAEASERDVLKTMARAPSAFWIDSKSKIHAPAATGGLTDGSTAHGSALNSVEGILRNASGSKQLVVLMVYNLPK